jgi:hypothetical protein
LAFATICFHFAAVAGPALAAAGVALEELVATAPVAAVAAAPAIAVTTAAESASKRVSRDVIRSTSLSFLRFLPGPLGAVRGTGLK